jgi:hypothetical protein
LVEDNPETDVVWYVYVIISPDSSPWFLNVIVSLIVDIPTGDTLISLLV